MHTRNTRHLAVFGFLAALVIGASQGYTVAQEKKGDVKKPETPKVKLSEKRVAFSASDMPWAKVLKWLSDQTEMPVISPFIPTGTFNFIAPKTKDGKAREYTIPEVIDILNRALLAGPSTQKYLIIREEGAFVVYPADESIPDLARIEIKDLPEHGKTEMVSIVMTLTTVVAEDMRDPVKKQMGPFGKVVVIEPANQLIMQDTVGNLTRIVKSIEDIQTSSGNKTGTFIYRCKYIKASKAAAKLKEVLGSPDDVLKLLPPQPLDRLGGGVSAKPAVSTPKLRMHYITADDATNKVIVAGPQDKIAQAKAVLEDLDVSKSGVPIPIGEPFLKSHNVSFGNAEGLVKALQKIYPPTESLFLEAINSSTIMVWAGPKDQIDIAKHLVSIEPPTDATIKRLDLFALDAPASAELLVKMFADAKGGAPIIQVQPESNSLLVKGTARQVELVEKALGEMSGKLGTLAGKNTRVINLHKGGSGISVGEELQRLLKEVGGIDAQIVVPGSADFKKPEVKKEKKPAEGP
jgi:type II secretory pathway component GspD/PulD (secretin)